MEPIQLDYFTSVVKNDKKNDFGVQGATGFRLPVLLWGFSVHVYILIGYYMHNDNQSPQYMAVDGLLSEMLFMVLSIFPGTMKEDPINNL